MKIVLLGPAGAGKGSVAASLHRDFNIPHISTGDMFRDNIKRDTVIGREAQVYTKQGLFVPDEITVRMLVERLSHADCANGFILDGFPRTLAQAEHLEKFIEIDRAIELDVSDAIVEKRLLGRYMCSICHVIHSKSIDDLSQCKACGASNFYQRDDDRDEVIRRRLVQYRETISDVREFYKSRKILHSVIVSAQDSPEDVYKKLMTF